jgi:hypothetical protein
MLVERRKVPRRAANEGALAIVSDAVRRRCLITDLSPQGARLGFGARGELPLRFDLLLSSGRRVKAQVVWQRDLVAGVHFDLRPPILDRIIPHSWLQRLRPARDRDTFAEIQAPSVKEPGVAVTSARCLVVLGVGIRSDHRADIAAS